MARIKITEDDITSFVTDDSWIATDWTVYDKINEDGTLGTLLFKSLDDEINKDSIIATLRNPDGTLYKPEDGSVARIRIRSGLNWSQWETKICTEVIRRRLEYQIPYKLP